MTRDAVDAEAVFVVVNPSLLLHCFFASLLAWISEEDARLARPCSRLQASQALMDSALGLYDEGLSAFKISDVQVAFSAACTLVKASNSQLTSVII